MSADEPSRPDGYDALPKRFKDYIRKIETDLRSVREQLPVKTKTNVCVKSGLQGEPAYLPNDVEVQWTLADGNPVSVEFSRHENGEQITVNGWTALIVIPEVSNSVRIASYRYDPATGRRAKK